MVKLSASTDYTKVLDSLLNDIYSGAIAPGMIHLNYYQHIAKELSKAVAKGLKGSTFAADDHRNTLKAYIEQNVHAFSAARSLTVLRTYNSFLLDDEGKLVSKERFKSRVADIDPILNNRHLEVERQDIIAAAQMADNWETLKAYPALQYSTVGDSAVRPKHAALDKLIIATNDPLLDRIYPVKDHGCRCTMIPAASTAIPDDRERVKQITDGIELKPYFKGHVGKERAVYNGDHPYYKNVKGNVSDLQAERDYGMRSVKQIYDLNDLPSISYMPNKDAADTWWLQKAGTLRGSFDVVAQGGISVRFNNDFRNHVLGDNADGRYGFLHKCKEVVSIPDEVWAIRKKGVLETNYIKYYDDYPIVVRANDKGAFTMFQVEKYGAVNTDSLKLQRRGQLMFKNENR